MSLTLWSGCSLQPLQRQPIGDLGHVEFRKSAPQSAGVVIGAPHGTTDPVAANYATGISNTTGAGLVIAYGFQSKRIAVTQPLVRMFSPLSEASDPRRRGSIYPEFKRLLQKTVNGPPKLYVGILVADANSNLDHIEVATSGLSFEELELLKASFIQVRDQTIERMHAPRLEMALDPLDDISWRIDGVKHHGVLMVAERGINIRLPASLLDDTARDAYENILSEWIQFATEIARGSIALPHIEIVLLEHGKIELIPSSKQPRGVVVGAPHGTFDMYTARAVRQICSRTGFAAVIATGFTPTESGDGWRINVNRPTERHVSSSEREFETARAKKTYEQFKKSVLHAAQGNLDLYIDIHQNNGQRIEVASVGFSMDDARFIKDAYRALRDDALQGRPDIARVDLTIEPLDEIEVGAWAAKTGGILAVAKRSLHFELPSDGLMASRREREIYTPILTELIRKIAAQMVGTN